MYETLKDMGITDFEDIEKYTLRQEGDEDILKIYFRRKRGDLFAHSTKFRHGRSKKMVLVDSGKHKYKEVSEISPTMLHAVAELDQIVKHDQSVHDVRQRILNDIDHLEKVVLRKLEQLRKDVEQIE
ncbi:MAG: hypothetical protein C0631_02120 [Sedimenticola sp.]|jgi:hypothetical protein|nr:MAG: hypothetical protein C0631_02120 [Sedimenticola sp.]